MAKYNVVLKRKRAEKAVKKRVMHGDPNTGKLKNKPQHLSVSGKRQRKLFKNGAENAQGQKEAADNGLVTMQDVEMAVTEGTSQDTNKTKNHMKKGLKHKQLKCRGKWAKNNR